MKAIPDVVGDYHSTTHAGELHNTFLEFYVYNVYKGGEVEFKKVDQSGYMIEGATFELYLTDPSTDTSAITAYRAVSARNEETGLVEVDFGSVAYGTYYMMETNAPEGYVKDTNVYRVEVYEGESGAESCKIERKTADGWVELNKENNLYVFPNTPKYVNDFRITKVDEDGRQVNGARLTFERLVATDSGDVYVDYDFDTSTPGNQSTITVGKQDVSLGTGKYRVSETTIPTGYEKMIDYIYLTVNGENATIVLTDSKGNAIAGAADPDDSSKTIYSITNDSDIVIVTMEETTTTSQDEEGYEVTSHSYQLQLTNKLTILDIEIPIPVKKILKGRDMKANEFAFVLQPIDKNGVRDDSAKQIIYNPAGDANQEVEFVFNLPYAYGDIASAPYYDSLGNAVYYYLVYEEKGEATDIVYSETQYIVKVTLKLEEGVLKATPEYFIYSGEGSLPDAATSNLLDVTQV